MLQCRAELHNKNSPHGRFFHGVIYYSSGVTNRWRKSSTRLFFQKWLWQIGWVCIIAIVNTLEIFKGQIIPWYVMILLWFNFSAFGEILSHIVGSVTLLWHNAKGRVNLLWLFESVKIKVSIHLAGMARRKRRSFIRGLQGPQRPSDAYRGLRGLMAASTQPLRLPGGL